MSDWMDIAALDDVPQRGSRVVKTPGGCVAVFRTAEDEVYALNNSCPHMGGPLSEGIVHGASVTCPLHNWVFSLETGQARGADIGRVDTYPAKVENGRILLDKATLNQRIVA
ncbi:nitrite reductase small subunit NirD [uncultured Sulfitobacter sp.]|uniref:nitrite reductase small subunit NirD n=1 Tax=uncultured Sulfitobacter sp. TaxID=191468 RepID=UPI002616269E|nr:nitrite reductase small subunit NirD [uncultured Sulfitobacter sp.]